MSDAVLHIVAQQGDDIVLSFLEILVAYICCNRKPGGNRHADKVHLREVGTLAAKKIPHVSTSFGLAVSESIDSFFAHKIL